MRGVLPRVHARDEPASEVALLVAVGTGAGLALTLVAILVLRAVTVSTPGISLYRPTADPLALLSLAAFMAMVGLAAAYVPARRAARMNPLVVRERLNSLQPSRL